MTTFVVNFTYLPQPEALSRLRPERYSFFRDLDERGLLLASGQLRDSELGDGMLVLRAGDAAEAEDLLEGDPYRREGLVATREISQWNPSIGAWIN